MYELTRKSIEIDSINWKSIAYSEILEALLIRRKLIFNDLI